MERDAVHKALMSLLRQDPKGSLISFHLFCMKILILLTKCTRLIMIRHRLINYLLWVLV